MKRRLCSSLAAVLLLIGVMTGCSNVTYVAKVNGTEVPLRYYTVNMLITKIQFESAYGDNYKDYMTQPNSSDPEKTNLPSTTSTPQTGSSPRILRFLLWVDPYTIFC